MKYLLKRIFAMTIVLSMLLPLGNVAFAEEFENTDDMTMQYLEDELKAYLAEYHPEIEFGTVEFIDYFMGVLVEGTEEELADLPDYDEICYYGAEYMYELDQAQVEMEITEPFEIFLTSDEFRAKTIGEIKEEVSRKDAEDEKLYDEQALSLNSVYATTSSSYDADAAVRYARTYATVPNSTYFTHLRDCTNFVSQCVNAGGIPMKELSNPPVGVKDTVRHWYSITQHDYHGSGDYTTRHESSSWVDVDDFCEYFTSRSLAWTATVYNLEDLVDRVKPGDVVQLRRSSSDWYHSIIVTGYNGAGKMAYCGHSDPRKDRALTAITGANAYRILSFD